MRTQIGMLALLGAVTACGGGSAAVQADGPPSLSVLSGNNQVVSAAPSVALPLGVVAQVIRLPNGQVSMTTRVVDAMLPEKAYAQTAVNGIPGAVVCAVAPDPKHQLTPEVPCTNTDAMGKAYFTYHADTVAGVSKSQVRGTVNGITQVSDSVKATVMPGPAAIFLITANGRLTGARAGVQFNLRDSLINVGDRYNNFPLPRASYRIGYRRFNLTCTSSDANGTCVAYSRALTDPARIIADTITLRSGDNEIEIGVDSTWKGPDRITYIP
jgi:hypothetical protein